MKPESVSLVLITFILILVNMNPLSQGSDDQAEVSGPGGTWTILSYMNGEGNLEKFIVGDLMEMEQIGSSDEVNIVVQIDLGTNDYYASPFATWPETRRYLVEHHPEEGIGSTRLDDPPLGEIDMDDPDSLRDFLKWGLSNYPADHYMIALEGHSGGPARGIMEDRSSSLGDPFTMDVDLMGDAIRDAIDSTVGDRIDIISFDVCWMGMAEAATEIMDHADYMVGSFDEIPGAGWPYDRCLHQILNDTSPNLEDRLGSVVDEYLDHYDPDGAESYASLAVIDLEEFREELLPAIEYLAEEMFYSDYSNREIYDSILTLVDKPRLRNDNTWDRYVDLYQMAELISIDNRVPARAREAAGMVLSTEEDVLVAYGGGTNHPASSRLFGIYYPTIRNDERRYGSLVLSDRTAWDEHAAIVVEEIELTGGRVNWTAEDPGSILFEISTLTPGLVSEVKLEVILDGSSSNFTLTGQGGYYGKVLSTGGATVIQYRFTVRGLYSNHITLPPDGYATARIMEESNPPEVWHDMPGSIRLSSTNGGLSFQVRDQTGIELMDPEGVARLEYREVGSPSWYSIPLTLVDHDIFRGWMTYWGLPSGISSGGEVEYHLFVSDVYGNQARYPDTGELRSTMSEGKRFYLDAYRSTLSSYSELVDMFSMMGMSVEIGSQEAIPDLSGLKGYLLIQPMMPLSKDDADQLIEFHEDGGEILLIIDPNQEDQEVYARYLLEGMGIDITSEGSVDGFYPSNPYSELSPTLPSIGGISSGSIVLSDEMTAVYFTTPPNAALATGRMGKGKSVISVPDLFLDEVMDVNENVKLSELVISFLQDNDIPMIEYSVDPEGVLIPGQTMTIDLSGSFDRDGEIVSYSISISDNTHLEGPEPVFTHSFLDPGVYTLVMKAFDAEGEESSITYSVKVNRPPSLDHSLSSKTINSGDTVIFDYKGSDPDGDDIIILWDFGDGYKVQGKTVSHEYARKGTFTYTLTVTDANSIEVNKTGTINVLNSDPVAIIDKESIRVNAIPGNFSGPSMVTLIVMEGDTIYIPGDLSTDTDREDDLNLTWNMGDGSIKYGLHALYRYRSSGLFEVELIVSDGSGGIANTTMLISVDNRPPVAVFTVEKIDSGKIRFDASNSADDPWDIGSLKYEWDLGNGEKKNTEDPYLEYRYPFGGKYDVTLTVTDSDGASGSYEREVEASGMGFASIMIISLSVLLIMGVAGIVAFLILRRRLHENDQGIADLFRRGDPVPDEGERGGFSRPRKMRGEGNWDGRSGRPSRRAPSKGSSFEPPFKVR